MVIDKERAGARTGIFMVDASRGFRKDGPKNRLRDQDIHRIVDVFNRQTELPRYSRLVPIKEIASPANDYNLNIPRYIDASEPEDLHDLDAHLKGGIPDCDLDSLDDAWEVFPTLRARISGPHGRAGYSTLRVGRDRVRAAIAEHPEVCAYAERIATVLDGWSEAHRPALFGLHRDTRPRELIATLSEDLLDRFRGVPLLDAYDVYQRLMDYWIETMLDDVYLVTSGGWRRAATPRLVVEDKKRKIKETPDLTIGRKKYKMDLIPPDLVIARSFADEQAALDEFRAHKDAAANELQEFIEEHASGDEAEDAPLAAAVGDRGKVVKARVKELLTALPDDTKSADERQILERCLSLLGAASRAGRDFGETQTELAESVLRRYASLSESEVKALVVEDKWLASLRTAVTGEAARRTRRLAARIETLEDRYAKPLPQIECKVDTDAATVTGHLKRMGLSL